MNIPRELEAAIGRMLKNEELEEVPGEKDDLLGENVWAAGEAFPSCMPTKTGRSWKKRIR